MHCLARMPTFRSWIIPSIAVGQPKAANVGSLLMGQCHMIQLLLFAMFSWLCLQAVPAELILRESKRLGNANRVFTQWVNDLNLELIVLF